jgi:Bacterial Type VI secretion, VC_A0110, EvfL, ImpJ, VasE
LLEPGKFDRKFGSRQQIDRIFIGAFPGLDLTEVPQVPRPLPTQPGWVYYQVRQDGVAWLSVVNYRTLAMRFTREIVANADRLPGQSHIEVLWKGKRYTLQFWLFAIRPTRP